MNLAWFRSTSLRVLKFLMMKEEWPIFLREPILQNVWKIWSSLLYFNFKSSMDPNSASIITFQCILHDSGVLFEQSWNFYKLKMEDLISGVNQFCRMSQLFCHLFCISILRVFWTQNLHRSFHFNVFCMIQ